MKSTNLFTTLGLSGKPTLIYFSLIASTLLSAAATTTMINPLPAAFKSTDNGGTLNAIDAYKDGVGVVVLDNLGAGIQVDNTAMNTLVFKYGDAAKNAGLSIADTTLSSPTASTTDILNANIIKSIISSTPVIIPPADGTCTGGFAGKYMSFINCNGLTSLSAGWLNLTDASYIALNGNDLSITNVDNLSSLKTVNSVLHLGGNKLKNINGLRNATNIYGLYLADNPNLQDISGLNNLTYIYDLFIDNRTYNVKLSATSYICTHSVLILDSTGNINLNKNLICNP